MSAVARFPGTKPYGKTRGKGYHAYLLNLARERVELEIAANDFVRGAWRELRKQA